MFMMKHLKRTVAGFLCCGVVLLLHCADSVNKTISSHPENGAQYGIAARSCKSCGICFELCPERAIIETRVDGRWIYIIDPDRCVGCGICSNACRYGAISRRSPAY